MPKFLQRVLLWTLDFLGVLVIVFVPFYLLRYGVDAVVTQSFGEGIVVEVIGAIGTAVLIIILDSFAGRVGVRQDEAMQAQTQEIQALRSELDNTRHELAEIKRLLQEDRTKPPRRFFFWL